MYQFDGSMVIKPFVLDWSQSFKYICSKEKQGKHIFLFKGAALPLTPVLRNRENSLPDFHYHVCPNIFLPKDRKCRK